MISGIKNDFKQRAGEYKGPKVGVEQDRKLIAGGGQLGQAVQWGCGVGHSSQIEPQVTGLASVLFPSTALRSKYNYSMALTVLQCGSLEPNLSPPHCTALSAQATVEALSSLFPQYLCMSCSFCLQDFLLPVVFPFLTFGRLA